jgi:hypothetical protein
MKNLSLKKEIVEARLFNLLKIKINGNVLDFCCQTKIIIMSTQKYV